MQPGMWFIVCGFTTVFALLRKLKLEVAARLKVGDNRAGKIFWSLYMSDKGSFQRDAYSALKEWLLLRLWDTLDNSILAAFRKRILKVSRKCWPQRLRTDGNLAGSITIIWYFLVMFQSGRTGTGILKRVRICSSQTSTAFSLEYTQQVAMKPAAQGSCAGVETEER